MTFKNSSTRSAALALAVAGVLSTAAQAQTASTLEEIIVTAERREQSLQDLAVSATVLTSDTLAKQGVDNIIEIQQVAPSVAINTYNRGTFINIRGVGIAQSAPTSTPGVATYIDGVYIAHETFIAQAFYDIASIEVLRGPQGTLTGQNSTGGAIYMRTPAPQFEEFSGYIDQTAADYSWYKTVGAINIPMGDMFAARVAATYDTKDSFTTNIGPAPSQPGSSTLKSARVALTFKPIDTLSFDLRYEHFDLDSDYNAIKNRFDQVTTDPFTIEENGLSYLNQEGYRASLEGRWDITDGMQLRAITSKLDADNVDQADGDRRTTTTPLPAPRSTGVARVGYTTQSFDTRVTEVNLLSTGERKINWVVGAFMLDETTPVAVQRDQTSNGGNPVTFVTPAANTSLIARAENAALSGFGQLDMRLTDWLELGVGARYSKDEQEYTRYALPGPPIAGYPLPFSSKIETSETTGKLGAKVFAGDDMMYYVTLSKGYKAGGVNPDPRLNVFGPESNQVAEVGVKTTMAGGKLRINGDVFYSKYEDIQVSALVTIAPGATAPAAVNGPEAKIKGAELELIGQFDALGFNLGASLLSTETTEARTLTNSSVTPSVDAVVPAGTVLPFSPKWTVSGGVEYKMSFGDATLTPRLQANYLSEQWATFFHNDLLTKVQPRTIVDFRLTLNPNEHLTLEGFVTNLTDKTYVAVQVQEASSAAGGFLYGAPRQIGLRAKYSF